MGILQGVKFFRGLYEWLPRTLRTPLNTPYTPNTPNIPNELIELNTSNNSGFPISLKKLILTRCNARRGKRIEQIEQIEPLRVLYESNTRIIGMDRMDRKGRNAQGVI